MAKEFLRSSVRPGTMDVLGHPGLWANWGKDKRKLLWISWNKYPYSENLATSCGLL